MASIVEVSRKRKGNRRRGSKSVVAGAQKATDRLSCTRCDTAIPIEWSGRERSSERQMQRTSQTPSRQTSHEASPASVLPPT